MAKPPAFQCYYCIQQLASHHMQPKMASTTMAYQKQCRFGVNFSQEMCSIWAPELGSSEALLSLGKLSPALIFAHRLPLSQTNPNQSNSIANANHGSGRKNLNKFEQGKNKMKIQTKPP